VSGLLILALNTGQDQIKEKDKTFILPTEWLWVCVPFFGMFVSGIFPAAIAIPNDNRIYVRNSDKHWMTLGSTLGEIAIPLAAGLFWYYNLNLGFLWMLCGTFLLGIALFIATFSFALFSRDLAEMSQLQMNKRSMDYL